MTRSEAGFEQAGFEQAGFEQAGFEQAGFRSAARGEAETEPVRFDRKAADTLVSGLRAAWQRGWQPVDLHRLVSHDLTKRHLPVLVSAMVDGMHCYPAETVDSRWCRQLAEMGAPADRSTEPGRRDKPDLLASLPLHRTDRPTWFRYVTEIIGLVTRLGSIPVLLPPPGLGSAENYSSATEVDDRVLRRVRALLAKAESTQYPEEADAYTAAAQRMMTRHRIDSAMVSASTGSSGEAPTGRRIGIESPYETAKAMLLTAVAQANACKTVSNKGLYFCTVVGASTDLDVVERLFTSLLLQATAAMGRAGARCGAGAHARSRSFKRSFLIAYAVRIGERLAEASRAEVEEARARPGGGELVPVLAARAEEVDKAIDSFFPFLRSSRRASLSLDAEGWASGRGAADQAKLGADAAAAISR